MKWNRIELKEMAKTALRGSYWKSVLAAFLLAIATSALTSSSGWKVGADEVSDISDSVYGLLPLIFAVVLVAGCIGMALCAFVLRPLEVGCRRYFLEDIYYPADLNTLKAGFSGNYLNIVWIMFCRDIFTFLWTLLFIVPGIVKSYEYKMIPYLLAENPNLSREEAFALSKRMMDGEKMDTFILELSFIGWAILSAITMGMVGIFYYQPYLALTQAALYQALKWKIENNGDWGYGGNDGGYETERYSGSVGNYDAGGYGGNSGNYGSGGYGGSAGNYGQSGNVGNYVPEGYGSNGGNYGSGGNGGNHDRNGNAGNYGLGGDSGNAGNYGQGGYSGNAGNYGLGGDSGNAWNYRQGGYGGNAGNYGPGGDSGNAGNYGPVGTPGNYRNGPAEGSGYGTYFGSENNENVSEQGNSDHIDNNSNPDNIGGKPSDGQGWEKQGNPWAEDGRSENPWQ